jgi:hypothetical protein
VFTDAEATATYGSNPPGPDDGAAFTVPVDVPGSPARRFRAEGRAADILASALTALTALRARPVPMPHTQGA